VSRILGDCPPQIRGLFEAHLFGFPQRDRTRAWSSRYSLDDGMLKRKTPFAIAGIAFKLPKPSGLLLPYVDMDSATVPTIADGALDPQSTDGAQA